MIIVAFIVCGALIVIGVDRKLRVPIIAALTVTLLMITLAPGDPGLPKCPHGKSAVAVECK